MHFVGFLLFGLIVGAIAKLLVPGRDPGGIVITAVVGMVGSFLGGLIGHYVLRRGDSYTPGWVMSIVGTILLLVVYRWVM